MNIKTTVHIFILFLINSNALGETWIDIDGSMDVTIEMSGDEQSNSDHIVKIRDLDNFEYFDYIYNKIKNNEINDDNNLRLKIGFDVENSALDLIFLKSFKAYEENEHKVIELTTINALFTLNAFNFMLDKGAKSKLYVGDNHKYFTVLLNKWHEYKDKQPI